MKVAIATVQVPFVTGGAEILASGLQRELIQRGCEAEIVALPFKWYPPERILDCMLMARLVDLEESAGQPIDRVVGLKFPAYYIPHPRKVVWLLHQHRQAYELFGTPFGDLQDSPTGTKVAEEIRRWDTVLLGQLPHVYSIARNVSGRLQRYNGVPSEPLYHPPEAAGQYHCLGYGDFVLCPGRYDNIKRQLLAVEALRYARNSVRLVLIGSCLQMPYGQALLRRVSELGLDDRVVALGWVSLDEKIRLYAECLAVYSGSYDEDYGYVTLEALLSSKAVLTHQDSGGPLEFVKHEVNGLVSAPTPLALGESIARIGADPVFARRLGERGREHIQGMDISWDHVIERLLV